VKSALRLLLTLAVALATAAANALNNAEFVSQDVPTIMQPGQTYPISVTMRNTGDTVWPAASNYKLAGIGNLTSLRFATASAVPAGQTVTFTFNLTAPSGVAIYTSRWRMVAENVEWFGPETPDVLVKNGTREAAFVSQSVPAVMATGQVYPVSITLRNTGAATWTAAENYRLISKNPDHNNRWGLTFVGLPGGTSVAPGQEVTFGFNVTGPASGEHSFQWKMDKSGTEQFGPSTPEVLVRVGNYSTFVSQSVPTHMQSGQSYPVSMTLRNTGSTTWTAAGNYRLIPKNPDHNNRWGLTFLGLPGGNPVAPGEEVTFNFNAPGPAAVGLHSFQWKMDKFGTEQFGDSTPNVDVNVGVGDAEFVSQSVPLAMNPGQTYPVSITLRNNGLVTWTNAANYRLIPKNPDHTNRWGPTFVTLPGSGTVSPGQEATFAFNVTAPTTTGTHSFQWKMDRFGTAQFGQMTPNVNVGIGLDDAALVSQNVPAVMQPGLTYPVTVTMRNTGGALWTTAAGYKLRSQNPTGNSTWGLNEVALPASVGANDTAVFSFNVTAPSTPGTYNFQWRMAHGATLFGAQSSNVQVINGMDAASFVSQSVTSAMLPGQTYPVTVTMKNTGATTWSPGEISLGAVNPVDNTTWGLSRVALPAAVAPGANATFSFDVTAPSSPGNHNFQWRMVQGASGFFSAAAPNVAVNVATDDAAFVAQSVPAQMTPGQSYSVSVTLTNSGPSTWSPGAQFKLGSVNPVDNTTWSLSRAELPGDVPPGASVTIPFNVVAPAAAGTYNFQWRMLHDAVAFGAATQNVAVSVGAASPLAGMMFIHVDHLNTPRAIYDSAQQLRWRWDQMEPFGVNPPDENPSSLGAYEFNLRFPGQYFDRETNLHYNYFRDYDPVLGRYAQSDPIGLRGGLNTFLYVDGSPLLLTDPLGLISTVDAFCIQRPFECAEIIGDIIENAGRGANNECVANRAEALADTIRTIGSIAAAIGVIGAIKKVGSSGKGQGGSGSGSANGSSTSSATTAGGGSSANGPGNPKLPDTVSKQTITRPTPGADGARSEHVIERVNGDTISVTHRVTKDGQTIHQHQRHIGKHGTERSFPDAWIEYPSIGR
jgi:RHS repeat-associated protein